MVLHSDGSTVNATSDFHEPQGRALAADGYLPAAQLRNAARSMFSAFAREHPQHDGPRDGP
jgi:hypothetical protein